MRTFPAKYTSLDDIRTLVAQAAQKAGLSDKAVYAVQLAVDEACTNIIDHAYGGESEEQIEITCEVTKDNLKISMRDKGRPFDMDSVSSPDLNLPLSERQVGGLGIHLIRNLMDGINYKSTRETGNTLILTKNLEEVSLPPHSPSWLKLTNLGEQMLDTKSLASQRDRIQRMVARLVDGNVSVWLDESLFRLPDWDDEPIFPSLPPTDTIKQAFELGELVQLTEGGQVFAALPLEDHGLVMGALQVSRDNGEIFTQVDLEALEGIASIAVLTLVTAHRIAVEHWRIGQLSLVRQVGTQIANVMDVDELAKRVTKLIQETFRYYYVAVFTIDVGRNVLCFRSGARAPRRGRRKATPSLEIEMGQGLIGHVAQIGEEVLCPDVEAEPRYRFLSGLPETKSEIVLPLKIEDRVLGVLDVQSDRLNAFHPNDLLVLRALADNIAIAIEGARLYSALRRRADQLNVIAEVSKQATSTLDLSILMADVASLITERFGYPHVHLFTVHHNRRRISYEAGSGKRAEVLEGYGLDLDSPEGLVPWVARNRKSVMANDVSKEPRYRRSPLPPENTKAELVVPLAFDEKIMGVLDVQSDHTDAFSDDDLLLFEALGDNIAAAIHNADLYRSEQWRRQVADSLREVAGLLSDNVNVEQVLDATLTELERNLPSEIATLWLLRDEGDIYLAAAHGLEKSVLESARRSSADASIFLASALLSQKPIIRKPEDVMGPIGLAADYEQNYSSIAAPLHIGDQPVGVLTLSHHTPGRYGHEAQAMTSTFASYAAVAIENARLYDSAQEQAYASAALLQVAQAVASLGELDEILDAIIRIMPILVGVERCAIYLWDEIAQQYTCSQEYGLSDEDKFLVWQDVYFPGEFPLLDGVRETSTMLLRLFDVECCWLDISPPWDDGFAEYLNRDDDLLMAVPVGIKNDFFGVLLAEEAPGGLRFRSRRLEIITGIAQQAALAIQNDRLQEEMVVRERLEHEVQVARGIQKTFIPETLPDPSNWELAARWQTARQVGGDFYDVIELPGQRLGLFIADVADKGIPAALFMALTRTLVRAAVIDTESPAEAMRRVNDLLIPDTQQGMFVTAVYGTLSLKTGEFIYANAGHNPPFWLQKDTGKITRLTRTGMALGVLKGAEMEQREIQLGMGDFLLLYTDGLTEAFSPEGDLFGEKRLKDALSMPKEESVQKILDFIESRLNEFMSTMPPADDLTMLAVRRLT